MKQTCLASIIINNYNYGRFLKDALSNNMKILGVGLSKTGTTSLHRALKLLGFSSIHCDTQRLNDILDGSNTAPDFRRYDDVDAVTDLPTAYFYEELLRVYPECKCILTVRQEDAWWNSIEKHFNHRVPLQCEADNPHAWQVRNYVYGSATAREFLYRKRYRQHNQWVREKIPAKQLLVMDITAGDGWQKLCPFLGLEIPQIPFPHENKRDVNWRVAAGDITKTIDLGETLILVSDGWLGTDALPGRKVFTFLERDGQYWGCPADSKIAIQELECLRKKGANFIVFIWASFWWLDYYYQFEQYLLEKYCCILRNDRCVIFALSETQLNH